MKLITINIADHIAKNLQSRVLVREFYDFITNKNYTKVVIDFEDVSFISRSFMDEFYNVILKNPIFEVELLNLSKEIQTMLKEVEKTQIKSNKLPTKNSNKELSFSSVSELNSYLNSLSFL